MWISKRPPVCTDGTRFGYSTVAITSVQKGFAKVSRTDRQGESHSHWQPFGVWQSLWRVILESLPLPRLTVPKQTALLKERDAESRTKLTVLLRELFAELKKGRLRYCCNPAWMKSGRLIQWNVAVICEKVQDLLSVGKFLGTAIWRTIQWAVIPFGSMIEYHPVSAKDQSRFHQFGKKVLLGIFLRYAFYAGGIWNGDIVGADIEELDNLDASEVRTRRLIAKEVVMPNTV